jgi:hypothetical protein
MAKDVSLYAEGEITDEELATGAALLRARATIVDTLTPADPVLIRSSYHRPPRVELATLSRYYSPTYDRGHWPSIYAAIRLMQAAFPHCRIFYGSDEDDSGQECTDEFLAGIWRHFLRVPS